jgi:protein-tyrosine-phosphatase
VNEPVRPAAFITRPPEKVLFLCIHNSTRSQIAEGFARSMARAPSRS